MRMSNRQTLLAALGVVGGLVFWGIFGLVGVRSLWRSTPSTPISPEGTWKALKVEMEGKVVQDEDAQSLEMVFAGDRVTTVVRGTRHQGVFTLNPNAKPAELDIKPAEGNTTDVPLYGIYELTSGGDLQVCFSPTKRPASFSTEPGRDWVLLIFRSTKHMPADPQNASSGMKSSPASISARDPGPFSEEWRKQLFRTVVSQRNYKVIPYDNGWLVIFRTSDKPAPGSVQEETHYREFWHQARALLRDPGQGNRPARLGKMYLAIDGWEDSSRPHEYNYVYFMPNVK